MRNISFALTTEQIRNRTKTVTRRIGWADLKVGTLLQPIVKGQGIPKGGRVEKIGGPIRVVSVRREVLHNIVQNFVNGLGNVETVREGFPEMTGEQFVQMFCSHNGCSRRTEVTRIEFEYVEDEATEARRLMRLEGAAR